MMAFLADGVVGSQISPEAKLELLHEMWDHGMHIIPCGSPNEVVPQYFRSKHPFDDDIDLISRWAKTPRVRWASYQKIQPSQDEITQWHTQYPNANWAAITGITFAVVDADADEAVEWIDDGNISRSPLVQTSPRGGKHYFYSLNSKLIRNSVGKSKLDVRGDGGYIMIAPSVGYVLTCSGDYPVQTIDDLPTLSEQDIENIHVFNTGDKVETLREKLTEDPQDLGSRNDTLARLAGKWIREGWGMREVLIKAQDWNQTCHPPMDLIETTRTAISIINGHIKRHPDDVDSGVLAWETSKWEVDLTEDLKEIQSQEDPLDLPLPAESGPLNLKPFSHQEWEDLEPNNINQFWGDAFIFEKSRVLLLGKPKIGKSNWLGGFAAGATTGTDFMDVPFSNPLKIIWFQADMIAEFLKRRIEMYYQRFPHDDDLKLMGYNNLVISGRLRKNLMRDVDIQAFSDEIAFHEADIVMIDPIINFFDGEENSNTEIRKLMDRIDMLMEMNNVAIILAHHTGKERADDKSFMSARGGSVFAGWFDSGVKLFGKKPNVNMFYEARNAQEPKEHLANFDFDEGLWNVNEFTPMTSTTNSVSEEDEVEIAHTVVNAMNVTKFYKRQELEELARTALHKAGKANGNKAGQKAVSYVQKYMGNMVEVHAVPGQAVWHYLATNQMTRPWEEE